MKPLGIRSRVLLIALVPAAILATMLAAYFIQSRMTDQSDTLSQRGKLLARQLATAADFPLFASNLGALARLVDHAAHEPAVTWVAVIDPSGTVLAQRGTGPRAIGSEELSLGDREQETRLPDLVIYSVPIASSLVPPDDLFSSELNPAKPPRGWSAVALSRAAGREARRNLLLTGLFITILVLAAAAVLAAKMSRGITEPMRRAVAAVEAFGRGVLSARISPAGSSFLGTLELGINAMAQRIEHTQAELERRVLDATVLLRDKIQEVEQANRAKTRFLAAASHDLRQPLHALLLFTQELRERPLGAEERLLVNRVETAAQALADLLDALLDISKLDAGLVQRRCQITQLRPLLDRLEGEFGPLGRAKGLRFRVIGGHQAVSADPLLLEQMLANLLSNAVRYTPSGAIALVARSRGNRVRLEVRDSGIGIRPEDQERVFEEFVQLANPERDRSKGLGLGLAIVRRLAALLDTRIELRSSDRGSVFAFELPARPAESPALEQQPQASAPMTFKGAATWLIEDDQLARESTARLLRAWDCSVFEFQSAEAALRAIDDAVNPPAASILIVDQRLPGLTGLQTVERIRARLHQPVPAVLISGDLAPELAASAQAHSIPVLTKPVQPARLRTLIHRLLAGF